MKYKVGDRVRIKNIDWYNKYKNKYGNIDYGCETEILFTSEMSSFCGQVVTITRVQYIGGVRFYRLIEDKGVYTWIDGMFKGLAEDETKNNNDMEEKETLLGWVKENDSLRLVPHKDYEIKHDGDNFYLVKKKKEYPKTYEKCCRILNINTDCSIRGYKVGLLSFFQMLLICRDAYWKIAGEKMGLGKPWEPDWRERRYIIYRNQDDIIGGYREAGCVEHHIFEFPTSEMRDAFKENFDTNLEICKEFL